MDALLFFIKKILYKFLKQKYQQYRSNINIIFRPILLIYYYKTFLRTTV